MSGALLENEAWRCDGGPAYALLVAPPYAHLCAASILALCCPWVVNLDNTSLCKIYCWLQQEHGQNVTINNTLEVDDAKHVHK